MRWGSWPGRLPNKYNPKKYFLQLNPYENIKNAEFYVDSNLLTTGSKNVIGKSKASFRQKTMRILSFSRVNTFCKCFLLLTFSEDFDLLWNPPKFLLCDTPRWNFIISLLEEVSTCLWTCRWRGRCGWWLLRADVLYKHRSLFLSQHDNHTGQWHDDTRIGIYMWQKISKTKLL